MQEWLGTYGERDRRPRKSSPSGSPSRRELMGDPEHCGALGSGQHQDQPVGSPALKLAFCRAGESLRDGRRGGHFCAARRGCARSHPSRSGLTDETAWCSAREISRGWEKAHESGAAWLYFGPAQRRGSHHAAGATLFSHAPATNETGSGFRAQDRVRKATRNRVCRALHGPVDGHSMPG